MVVADDGLGAVHFDDAELAQSVSVVALVLILFEGGLSLRWQEMRAVLAPAIALATVGVGITATIVAGAAYVLLDLSGTTAWLLAAVVASTDAAAVMSVLRRAPVPKRAVALLEVESGLNDPIAVLLTVGILETWAGDASGLGWLWFGFWQVGGGVAHGGRSRSRRRVDRRAGTPRRRGPVRRAFLRAGRARLRVGHPGRRFRPARGVPASASMLGNRMPRHRTRCGRCTRGSPSPRR